MHPWFHEYFVVFEESLSNVEDVVNRKIGEGWQPLGPPSFVSVRGEVNYMQAIVRHRPDKPDPNIPF